MRKYVTPLCDCDHPGNPDLLCHAGDCTWRQRVEGRAELTGRDLLVSALAQAERCEATGCVPCAREAAEYRAALGLKPKP
jgi:hypothetical protein